MNAVLSDVYFHENIGSNPYKMSAAEHALETYNSFSIVLILI
jgi:hypothetical protein